MSPYPKRSRPDGADAFVPDPQGEHGPLPSADAESLAEEFIASATSAEPVEMDAQDEVVDEELGGPFIGVEGEPEPEPEPELEGEISEEEIAEAVEALPEPAQTSPKSSPR